MKKLLILLLLIPNFLLGHQHVTAEEVISEKATNVTYQVYARGIVEALVHSYSAFKVINGIEVLCYEEAYSTGDFVSIIDGYYLKNKSLFSGSSYVFTADYILRENFPCN